MSIEELKAYIEDLKALLKMALEELASTANPAELPPTESYSKDGWSGPDENGGFTYDPVSALKATFAAGNRAERYAAANAKELNTLFVTEPFEVSEGYHKWVADNYNEAQRKRVFLSPKYGWALKPVYSSFHSDPGQYNQAQRTRPDEGSRMEGYGLIWAGNLGIKRSLERFEKHVATRLAYDLYNQAVNQLARLDRMHDGLSSSGARAVFISAHKGYEPGPRVSTATADNPYSYS